MIYTGHVDKCLWFCVMNPDDVNKFNTAMEQQGSPNLQNIKIDVDEKTFDGVGPSEWFMSDEYKELHVEKHVLGKLITDGYKAQGPEYARAFEELEQFKKRGMINLLRYMIYP